MSILLGPIDPADLLITHLKMAASSRNMLNMLSSHVRYPGTMTC